MQNIAVILAGGRGSRMGTDIPKQFIRLQDGRTVLETCVAAFQQNEHIDLIAIVILPDHKAEAQQLLPPDRYDKVHFWIDGGSERWESSLHAIEAINTAFNSSPNINLLIHDCARPFVSQRIITETCLALRTHEAVTVAVPVTDTLYQIKNSSPKVGEVANRPEEYEITAVPPRALFRRAQTPQGFHLSVMKQAFDLAMQDADRQFTDDVGVVLRYLPDVNIVIIPGEEANRKIIADNEGEYVEYETIDN